MKPTSSASEITAKVPLFYPSMPNPANEQLQGCQGNVFATPIHHESEGVSTELKLGYGSCITTKRNSSENLANFSLLELETETARAIKRMKLEEGGGPNVFATIFQHESEGVSTELKLGYGSCITTKRNSSENLANFSLLELETETARAIKRMKLEEGGGPNGVSLELKLGLPDPWDIKKLITFSDINSDKSRLLLPTALVKKHILPQWDESRIKNGVLVSVWDFDTESEYQLKFKQWPSNGSYVLIGNWIGGFARRRGLKEGDEIGLYWDQSNSRFSFSLLKQASSN